MSKIAQPLVMVEVIPIINITDVDDTKSNHDGKGYSPPIISTPSAKLQLLNMSRQGMFTKGWLDTGDGTETAHCKKKHGVNKRDNDIATKVMHDDDDTSHYRGLWLKTSMKRGQKCEYCRRRRSNTVKPIVNDGVLHNHHGILDKTIIDGDLIFHGKNNADIDNIDTMHTKSESDETIPITYLQSDYPLLDNEGVPCYLRGYIQLANNQSCCYCYCQSKLNCFITIGTVVQICHPFDASSIVNHIKTSSLNTQFLHQVLSGRQDVSNTVDGFPTYSRDAETTMPHQYSKLSCYNRETVESLTLRMSTMLANTVWIGTTPHALSNRKKQQQELELMDMELEALCEAHSYSYNQPSTTTKNLQRSGSDTDAVPLLLREGALLVYNSYPSSGKTILVSTIAKDILKCHSVHVISAPTLFAKYGTSADAALESMLHELALKCAVKSKADLGETAKVCIILDHLETFLPLSRQAGGDPYLPVMNAMGKCILHPLFTRQKNSLVFIKMPHLPSHSYCFLSHSCIPE